MLAGGVRALFGDVVLLLKHGRLWPVRIYLKRQGFIVDTSRRKIHPKSLTTTKAAQYYYTMEVFQSLENGAEDELGSCYQTK